MSSPASMAVVLDGGFVQCVIAQNWPSTVPLPRLVVVDYDTEGADEEEITQFSIGDTTAEAICRVEPVSVYESFDKALSPTAVLAALGEPIAPTPSESPLAVARGVRQSILNLHGRLKRHEKPCTDDGYIALYETANRGLIEVLKALGDQADFRG